MSFIAKTRRNYAAPTAYLVGGGDLHGMNGADGDIPITEACRAENLWRTADGSIAKRPGTAVTETLDIDGTVLWQKTVGEILFTAYRSGDAYYLRRHNGSARADRPAGTHAPKTISLNGTDLIVCDGEWIIVRSDCIAVTKNGMAALPFSAWQSTLSYDWTIGQALCSVPLIRAGGSPTGEGKNVLPPGLLCPLVQESFCYTETHRDDHRNRFCLALSPEVRGNLPTDGDGGVEDLTDEQKQRRVQTLTDSARLEVRLTKTDAYGNTETYWTHRAWSYKDNINAVSAAFWVQTIHTAALAYDGEDNIRITYFNADTGRKKSAGQILDSEIFTRFGVGGKRDRLFVAHQNRIRYSGMDDALYFGTMQYFDVDSDIFALAGEDTVMTVLTDHGAFRVSGSADTGSDGEWALDAFFTPSAKLPLPSPAIRGKNPIVAGGELLFLTEDGVCAVTPSGVLDERRVQIRSRRLDSIWKEQDFARGDCAVWNGYLLISGQNGIALLDLERKVGVVQDTFSTHGYEAYYWSGIHADAFGDTEQSMLTFYGGNQKYTFTDALYADETDSGFCPVRAVWQTAELDGGKYRCTDFYALTVNCKNETSLAVWYSEFDKPFRKLYSYNGVFKRFRYAGFHYGEWNYNGCFRTVYRYRLPFRHTRALRLRLENDIPTEPFCLREFIMEMK